MAVLCIAILWGRTTSFDNFLIKLEDGKFKHPFSQADSGAVTLIQPSLPMTGSAAYLDIHLHCLVLDGVYRCDTEGEPVFG